MPCSARRPIWGPPPPPHSRRRYTHSSALNWYSQRSPVQSTLVMFEPALSASRGARSRSVSIGHQSPPARRRRSTIDFGSGIAVGAGVGGSARMRSDSLVRATPEPLQRRESVGGVPSAAGNAKAGNVKKRRLKTIKYGDKVELTCFVAAMGKLYLYPAKNYDLQWVSDVKKSLNPEKTVFVLVGGPPGLSSLRVAPRPPPHPYPTFACAQATL